MSNFKFQVYDDLKQRQEAVFEDKRDAEQYALSMNDKDYPEQRYTVCDLESEPQTWAELARAAQGAARECRSAAERQYRGSFLKARECELLACNGNGRTSHCEPIFNMTSKLSGKWIREQVAYIKKSDPEATCAALDGGFDLYETFQDLLGGGDYEPSIETWEIDVPKALWDSI